MGVAGEGWVMTVEVGGGLKVALFEASPYARPPASSCPEWGAGPWDLQAFPSEPLDPSVPPSMASLPSWWTWVPLICVAGPGGDGPAL